MDQRSLFLDTIQLEPQKAEAGAPANGLRTRHPIAVDLFAGIGGFSLGFEQAGFDVVASVEYDPVHAAVHAYNFPLTHVLCADISALSVDDLRQAVERGYDLHTATGKSGMVRSTLFSVARRVRGFLTLASA